MGKYVKNWDKKNNYRGWSISEADEGWGYYVCVGTGKTFHYWEYSAGCNTFEGLVEWMKKRTPEEINRVFDNEYVYLECVERV